MRLCCEDNPTHKKDSLRLRESELPVSPTLGMPEQEDEVYSRWTVDLEQWLIPVAEHSHNSIEGRVKKLLKHINKRSLGGQAVAAVAVECLTATTTATLVARFPYGSAERAEAEAIEDLAELKWFAIKHRLKALRTQEDEASQQTRLSSMKRDARHENLLEFVMRYRRSADQFIAEGSIAERRALQLLYDKFPRDFQLGLQWQPFQSMNLSQMEALVRNKLDWISFSLPGVIPPDQLADYMDHDTVAAVKAAAAAARSPMETTVGRVHGQESVDFESIQTIADFKNALRVLSYRSDIQEICREVLQESSSRRSVTRRDLQQLRAHSNRDGRPWQRGQSNVPRVVEMDRSPSPSEGASPQIQTRPGGSGQRTVIQEAHMESDSSGPADGACVFRLHTEGTTPALMYCDIELDDHSIIAVIDAGAAISLIPSQTCIEFGFYVDTSQAIWITGVGESKSRTKGMTCVEVQVLNVRFWHTFQVVNFGNKQKIIMGNDLLKKHGFVSDPVKAELRLSDVAAVPCHVTYKASWLGRFDGLLVQRLQQHAKLPDQGTEGGNGYDLYSAMEVDIPPGTRRRASTGWKLKLPNGCYGRIAGRSGLGLPEGVVVAVGLIDPEYDGEIGVILCNNGQEDFHVDVGMRIAQLICEVSSAD